jgi:hypothetical protein
LILKPFYRKEKLGIQYANKCSGKNWWIFGSWRLGICGVRGDFKRGKESENFQI